MNGNGRENKPKEDTLMENGPYLMQKSNI
jgi:hypothetical protein